MGEKSIRLVTALVECGLTGNTGHGASNGMTAGSSPLRRSDGMSPGHGLWEMDVFAKAGV